MPIKSNALLFCISLNLNYHQNITMKTFQVIVETIINLEAQDSAEAKDVCIDTCNAIKSNHPSVVKYTIVDVRAIRERF